MALTDALHLLLIQCGEVEMQFLLRLYGVSIAAERRLLDGNPCVEVSVLRNKTGYVGSNDVDAPFPHVIVSVQRFRFSSYYAFFGGGYCEAPTAFYSLGLIATGNRGVSVPEDLLFQHTAS